MLQRRQRFAHRLRSDLPENADNNEEYRYWPGRTRIKAGTSVTFTNVGDIPHTATELKAAKWDAGVLEKGQSKTVTFSEPGSYYYICAPYPWMYGQVVVE